MSKNEVAWADQQLINEFSRLNSQQGEHERAVARLREDREYIDDIALELELADDDEEVQYRIGDFFVSLPASEVRERLKNELEQVDAKLAVREKQQDESASRMTELKSKLYAKFGSAINLDV